jgi:hypothetical protein
MLSGYRSALYDEALGDWTRHDTPIDNKASSAAVKRQMTENLWCNF